MSEAKCRLCRRTMRPRTNTRPDKVDPSRCADCAILSRAFAPRGK